MFIFPAPAWYMPMTLVFMGLVLAGLCILLFKAFSSNKKASASADPSVPAGLDPTVVAAISAAVYATLSQTNPNACFTIRSIRRR